MLEADEYTEITVVSNGILQLSYDKERNAPMQYMKYDSDGNLSDYKHKKFSADSLYTYESQADDSGTDAVYSLMILTVKMLCHQTARISGILLRRYQPTA